MWPLGQIEAKVLVICQEDAGRLGIKYESSQKIDGMSCSNRECGDNS